MARRKQSPRPERTCELVYPEGLAEVVERQADLTYVAAGRHHEASGDDNLHTDTNEEAWDRFRRREFHDTRRVTLERFHLFEWFPLVPGRFHTQSGRVARATAQELADLIIDDQICYNPSGKLQMLLGGVGCVRLRPRLVGEVPREHYFMTASSNGVCHEGFPVLVPRTFFGALMRRLLKEGAVPATLSGEMRYISPEAVPLFNGYREVPLLYLHVDKLKLHRSSRQSLTNYAVSVVVSFRGTVQDRHGTYVTYDTFDPATPDGVQETAAWIDRVYVGRQHGGVVITDFDEVEPQFPQAPFALPPLLTGRTNVEQAVQDAFEGAYAHPSSAFIDRYRNVFVNTQGGAYIQVEQRIGTVQQGATVTGVSMSGKRREGSRGRSSSVRPQPR